MHRLKVMLAFLLLAFCGVPFASAAGIGTFSIEQTTVGVGVGQFGVATLYMDNTWQPPADSVSLYVGYDPAILRYVSTDWKVGNSVAATPVGTNEIQFQFADYTNKYPGGRVPIADLNFQGLAAGQSTLGIRIENVRSHEGISETNFTELTASSLSNPGIFTVGPSGGTVTITPVVPTLTVTIAPTPTGNVTGTITTPITIPTTLPTTGITTGITTGAPFIPVQGSTGDSEEYTGVLTRTPTVTATTTATATATATVTANATATSGTETGNVTVTATATPVMNMTTGAATATQTTLATTTAATTTARTTVPVNTTATRAGADMLPLAVAGLAALALIATRRR